MSIRPDNLTLDKLLQGKLFRIPDYQRAYSWESKQRKDLFTDITKLFSSNTNNRHHFMSTVVCLQTDKTEEVGADEFGVFQIVDGQQRITTLIILLKALSKGLRVGDDQEQRESLKLSELLVKENGRLILLQTNHDSKRLFRNYLEHGVIPDGGQVETLAERNMIKAFQECEDFVNNWQSHKISLLKLVKNRLDFIFYVVEDEGAVHTIFEVLNSRGLEVDWLDKCKSMLMGIAFQKLKDASGDYIEELRDYWAQIYRTIGLNKVSGQEVLRFCAALEDSDSGSKISSPENAMEYFRQKCESHPKKVLDTSSSFLEAAKRLEEIAFNKRLKAVTKISHARLLAIAIKLNQRLSNDDKNRILNAWEKVTFRIFGLYRRDARTKVGEYVRLARNIFRSEDHTNAQMIIESINSLGADYPSDRAAAELKDSNCYEGWEDELVYFFYRYEEYLAKERGGTISEEIWVQVWNSSPTRTIEHIHPQNLNDEWRDKFGVKKDYVERQAQRLGNLALLPPGVNSSASDRPFKEKKMIYNLHRHLKLIDEILEVKDWDSNSMQEREERLIKWASEEWRTD